MTESFAFNRKCLVEIRVGKNHDKVHPAWQDDTNEGFLICYDVNLVFDDQSIFLVQPCEIEIKGRYPGLGLSLKEIEAVNLPSLFKISCLPMRVEEMLQTDCLGEDVINQYIVALENGSKIVIRHVFPPMTIGIRFEHGNA